MTIAAQYSRSFGPVTRPDRRIKVRLASRIAASRRCMGMSAGKPRKSADPLYLLLREGNVEEFNRRHKAGETCDLRGCDFRGIDLRGVDVASIDFSDSYFRQADLRGLDLRDCQMHGASLHAAHISGAYFPPELSAVEIEMSVRLGTRMRHSR